MMVAGARPTVRNTASIFVAAAVGIAVIPRAERQQSNPPIVITDEASCESCRLVARLVHTLSLPEGLCAFVDVTWTGKHYAVSPGCNPYEILLVAPNGTLRETLATTSSDESSGSGRFQRLASDGNGFLLVHSGTRIRLYDDAEIVLERRVDIPMVPRDLAILGNGGFLVASTTSDRRRAGDTLHMFDHAGKELHSFAPEQVWQRATDRLSWRRVWWDPRTATIWSAKQFGDYKIEQWTTDGAELRSFLRDPSAFSGGSRWDSDSAPSLRGLRAHDSLLWTAILVRSGEEELAQLPAPSAAPLSAREADGRLPDNAVHLRNDTIIEVVDSQAGSVLVTRRFSDALLGFLPGPYVRMWTYRRQRGGPQVIEIHELSIDRTPR